MEEREEVSQREIEKLQRQLQQQEASHKQTVTILREEVQREAQKAQQQETQQKVSTEEEDRYSDEWMSRK